MKKSITTHQAPAAIGTYSQAVTHAGILYVSGQIPLVPARMELISDDIGAQISQVFDNLNAVISAAGATLDDAVRFTVYLTDLVHFPLVNEAMAARLTEPYPARVAVAVSALPKGALIEVDAIVALG